MFSVNTAMNEHPLPFSLPLPNQGFSVQNLKCKLVKFTDRSHLPPSFFYSKNPQLIRSNFALLSVFMADRGTKEETYELPTCGISRGR